MYAMRVSLNIKDAYVSQWRIQDITLVGAWTFSTGWGRKSLKVELKVIFSLFWP